MAEPQTNGPITIEVDPQDFDAAFARRQAIVDKLSAQAGLDAAINDPRLAMVLSPVLRSIIVTGIALKDDETPHDDRTMVTRVIYYLLQEGHPFEIIKNILTEPDFLCSAGILSDFAHSKPAKAEKWIRDAVDAVQVYVNQEAIRETATPEKGQPIAWCDLPCDAANLPRREWLIPGLLERKQVTQLSGHGGSGKSTIALGVGIAGASNLQFNSWKPVAALRVAMVNMEDDPTEQQRRTCALQMTDAFKGAKLPAGSLVTLRRNAVKLVEKGAEGAAKRTHFYDELIDDLKELRADVVILDPLAELTIGLDENSAEMHELHAALREMAQSLNAAVMVVHHFNKMGTATNQNSFRGSSTLGAGARICIGVERMNKEDGDQYAVPEDKRPSYVKCYVSKANNTATGAESWFHLRPFTIGNGETVAAVEPWHPIATDPTKAEWLDAFLEYITAGYYTTATRGPAANRGDLLLRKFGVPTKQLQTTMKAFVDAGILAIESRPKDPKHPDRDTVGVYMVKDRPDPDGDAPKELPF
jgi:hypothetical protein